jgi:hypothetical protein
MELYGSLLNISGSVTASTFTGSFIGDGSGLSGIQASGVTGLNLSQISSGNATASISTSGFTVNKNTQIQGNLSVTGALIANEYIVSSSVIYMTTSFASGSSAFGNDNNDIHQFTGSVQISGSISLNGVAIGTGKLDETTFQSYTSSNNSRVSSLETSSGSLNSFTSSINTTIKSKLDSDNVISGSVQIEITGTTGYSTFSSSISNSIDSLSSSVATTITSLSSSVGILSSSNATIDLNQDNRLNALETSSGSLNSFTSSINTTIKSKLDSDNVISSSVQIEITGTTGYSTFSSSVATTDLNQENRLNALETSSGSLNSFTSSINTTIKDKLNTENVISSSAQILSNSNIVSSSVQVTEYGFATTGSNLFKGTQTLSGSILPSVDNTYDLGSADYQWRDVYISSGSLYIDGTKVLSSTAQELTITTDNGQSIKILEGTTDSIILQTADGDIELKSSGDGDILLDPTNGKIMLKGPVEILNGQKIQSSVGGTPVVFANDIVVSGSIDLTGTIDGIDLILFSSSLNTRLGNLETSTGSLNEFTSSTNSRLTSIETSTGSLNSYTSSNNTRLGIIETTTGSLNTYTSSNTTNINAIHISTGSLNSYTSSNTTNINAIHTATSSLNSYTSSNTTNINAIHTATSSLNSYTSSNNERLSTIETSTGSLNSYTSSNNTKLGIIEGTTGSLNTFTSSANTRLVSIENKTGSYATTGSNIFQGTQIITGSLFISQDLIIAGSSSIQNISSSVLNISDNIITVNAVNPSVRFGGLAVIDSGSSPQVSGSMLYDSVKDEFLFVHQNQGIITSSVLLMGPETFNNIGNEAYITQNRLTKGSGVEHLNDSNITDTGTKVSINSNTEITGSLIVAGGNKITVNGPGGDEGGEILLSKATTNTTLSGEGVTIDVFQNRLRFFEQGGNARGAYLDISTLGNGASTNLLDTAATASYVEYSNVANKPSLVSGSSQITFLSIGSIPPGLVSGSSQVLVGSGIWSGSSQLPSGVVSGSAQLPSGLVSGSSQVLAGTTIHSGSFFNGITVVSGSGQISFNGITDKPALVSGSSQISFNSISDKPALVSGSSQISFNSISDRPALVSGSAQIDLTATTNYSSGIKTRLNAEGVISGSAQLTSIFVQKTGDTMTGDLVIRNTGTFNNIKVYSNDDNTWVEQTKPDGTIVGRIGFDGYSTSTAYQSDFLLSTRASSESGLTTKMFISIGNVLSFQNLSGFTYNGNTIWHSGNDGASSGLDADLLDGSHASAFSPVAGSSSITTVGTIATGVWNGTAIAVANGGTGASTAANAITNLGATTVGGNLFTLTNPSAITFPRINANNTITALSAADFRTAIGAGTSSTTGTVTSVGGTGTVSGLSLSGTVTSTGNLTLGGTLTVAASNFSSQTANTFLAAPNGSSGTPTFRTIVAADVPTLNQNTSGTASNITAFTINQSVGTSNTVQFANLGVGVSPAILAHFRGAGEMIRFENTSTGSNEYTQLNFKAGTRNGYIWVGNQNTTSWAGNGGLNIYTDFGNMDFWTNNIQRVRIASDGHMVPFANNTYDLGSSSLGWRNVFTNDLHLSNMNKPEGNDIDGTNGTWTIQEGAENLYIINNNNGKKFKILLEEIV